jgi:hypothetical protein
VRLRHIFPLLGPLLGLWLGVALPAFSQDGIRVPARPGAGIDPMLAGGWLSPRGDQIGDRFGYGPYHWRDSIGFAPTQRMQWSYAFGSRSSVGMSMASGRDYLSEPVFGADARQYGLVGRYSLAPDWSLSAETVSRDPSTLFRLQDFRIGLRRQF